MGDKYFANVQALLSLDGVDASTTFTDAKGHTFTGSGNAQLDTAQKRWGTASLLLDGTGDFVTSADSADWTLGAGDFTVEAWVRFAVAPGASNLTIASHWLTTGSQRAWILNYNNNLLRFIYNENGTTSPGNVTASGAWNAVANRWYHVAVSRNSTSLRLFIDGVQVGSTHTIGATAIHDSTTTLQIGCDNNNGTNAFNGWVDEFRLTVGVGRYATDFATPRGPFPQVGAVGVAGQFANPMLSYHAQEVVPAFEHTISVPEGTVGSDLTNFPIVVPLADLPATFWDSVRRDGRDIRVENSVGAQVPVDIVSFDPFAHTGYVVFLAASVLAASNNTWTLTAGDPVAAAIAVDDPLGRNAVWAAYEVVYMLTGEDPFADRTGNHNLSISVGTPAYYPVAMGLGGGMRIAADTRLEAADVLATGTSFTLGASGSWSDFTGTNRSLCSYQPTLGSNTDRAILAHRLATSRLSQFDDTNSWNDAGSAPSLNTPYRMHGVWNGTTHKRLYIDGVQAAEDTTVSAVGTNSDCFALGEGGASSSYHRGDVGFVYLRREVLSADFIAAEYLMLDDPATFFGGGVESLWVGALT